MKAEPKPKVAEKVDEPKDKLNTTKLDSLDNTGLKDEARVRNALGKRIPLKSVVNLSVDGVFTMLTQETNVEFRFDALSVLVLIPALTGLLAIEAARRTQRRKRVWRVGRLELEL